jgi:hypothetical protein
VSSSAIPLRHNKRRGAVIVAALVCLLIVVALLSALLTGTLRERRQLPLQRDLRQCELLVDAGIERAAYRLANDADYRGETWSVPADDAVGLAEGQVTIAVSRPAEDQPWQASIVAEYPLGGERSVRRSRSVSLSEKK